MRPPIFRVNLETDLQEALRALREQTRLAELQLAITFQLANQHEDVGHKALAIVLERDLGELRPMADRFHLLAGLADKEMTEVLESHNRFASPLGQINRTKPNPMGRWQANFSEDYDVPRVLTELFSDVTCDNDGCPSFILPDVDPQDAQVRIWCDHPNPAKREIRGEVSFRFFITDGRDADNEERTLLETDDLAYVVDLMRQPVSGPEAEAWVEAMVRFRYWKGDRFYATGHDAFALWDITPELREWWDSCNENSANCFGGDFSVLSSIARREYDRLKAGGVA